MEQIKHEYKDGNGRLLYTVVKFPNKEFFDENFFLYLENSDICLRVNKKGESAL